MEAGFEKQLSKLTKVGFSNPFYIELYINHCECAYPKIFILGFLIKLHFAQ